MDFDIWEGPGKMPTTMRCNRCQIAIEGGLPDGELWTWERIWEGWIERMIEDTKFNGQRIPQRKAEWVWLWLGQNQDNDTEHTWSEIQVKKVWLTYHSRWFADGKVPRFEAAMQRAVRDRQIGPPQKKRRLRG
jgi:hypothetical protein